MNPYSTFLSVQGQMVEKAFWPASGTPRAIVQLVHGMAEHIRRYEDTALALNAAGFTVVGHTHLGHGENARIKGYFGASRGWDALIEDVHALRQETQKAFPGVPYFLLGHSMGSFVVRGYCLKYEAGLSGVILSGTGHYAPAIVTAGSLIAGIQCALGMAQKPSHLLEKISSGGNCKGYPDVQTPFDWLSRDRSVVKRYIDDPLCGFTFTAAGYRAMFDGLSRLYPAKLSAMRPDIPICLLSGDKDPVGSNGAGVEQVARELRAAGVKDVTVTLYPEGRHEMFNELNRQQVWEDLAAWIGSRV